MNVKYYGSDPGVNTGDYFVYHAIKGFGFNFNDNANLLLIGGGTMLPISEKLVKGFTPERTFTVGSGVLDKPYSQKLMLNELEYDKNLSFTRKFLSKCKFVGLRDNGSKDVLGFGRVIGDPTYMINTKGLKSDGLGKYVILNVGFTQGDVIGGITAQLEYLLPILKFAKYYLAKHLGYKICIISFASEDKGFCSLAHRYLGKSHIYDRTDKKNTDIFNIFSNAEFAITYRQHAMITAIICRIPVIPIAYQEKVINVAKDFNIDKYSITTDMVTEEELFEKHGMLESWDSKQINDKLNYYRATMNDYLSELRREFTK